MGSMLPNTTDCHVCQICTTNACNAKCTFCFQSGALTRRKGVMSTELFEKIVREHTANIYNLCTFGEPLLDTRLVERVAFVRGMRPNAEIYFHTNASLLTPEKSQALALAGLSRLVVSIYGLTAEQHDRLMPPLKWHTVVENAVAAAKVLPVMVVSNQVEEMEIEKIRDFWNSRGCSTVFDTKVVWGPGKESSGLISEHSSCAVMKGYRIFDWDGEMFTCCFDFNGVQTYANAGQHTWEEAKARLRDREMPFCGKCPYTKAFNAWRKNL